MWIKVVSVILGIGAIVGGYIFIDDRLDTKYALALDLAQTDVRVEQHILQDRAWYIQKQMQQIEVQSGTSEAFRMPTHARDRYNDFKIELKQLEQKMKSLSEKEIKK
jgi:hypothetical protein